MEETNEQAKELVTVRISIFFEIKLCYNVTNR